MSAKIVERKLLPIVTILAAALITIAGGLLLQSLQSKPAGRTSLRGLPPPLPPLQAQTTSASAENSSGIFGIKGALVTHDEIFLFWTMYDTVPQPPDQPIKVLPGIAVSSCPPPGLGSCIPIDTTAVQSLGSLPIPNGTSVKTYQLGVVRIPWEDHLNYTLNVTASRRRWPDESVVQWQTSPLLQSGPKSNFIGRNSFEMFRGSRPSDITLTTGSLGGTVNNAAIKLSATQFGQVLPVHVAVDLQYNISVITAAQYAAFTAPSIIPPDIPDPNAPATPSPIVAPEP